MNHLEDSLEEFDVCYIESYNQVISKLSVSTASTNCPVNTTCNSTPRSERSNSISAQTQQLRLSSPLLEDKEFFTFCGQDSCSTERNHTAPTYNDDSPTTKASPMRPPLKPSVTIASIDTFAKFQKAKPAKRKDIRIYNPLLQGTIAKRRSRCSISSTSNVDSLFCKPNKYKSTSSIPTLSSFTLTSSVPLNISTINKNDDFSHQQKKRKLSLNLDHNFDFEFDTNDSSIGSESTSSVDSVLSLNKATDDYFTYDNKYLNDLLFNE